jgi:hypothetical protein
MATAMILTAFGLLAALLAYKGTRTLHERLYPEFYRSERFPEDRFPAKDEQDFRKKIARGYDAMNKSSLLICGISRNDEETLPLAIRRIEKTGSCFKDYGVVIFENDSTDRTPDILRSWERENPRVRILSESLRGLPISSRSRFERLAYCRNRYVDDMNAAAEYDRCEWVMVVDMDLRGGWSVDGLASTFADAGWDAVASVSLGYHYLRKTYYDTFALKPKGILKKNWSYRLFGEGWQFRRNDPLIPVQSAFGGLALYRRDIFRTRRYSGLSGGLDVCEHDALNADGKLRFFMNPSQITVVGTQEAESYSSMPPWRKTLYRLFLNW